MKMEKAVLDTSVVVDVLRGKTSLATIYERYSEVYLTTIGIGELYYGAYHSLNVDFHLDQCERIQTEFPLLSIDGVVSRRYGAIKQQLRQKGQMIPENDLWFAAITLTSDATIVTKDKYFERINGLSIQLVNPVS